MARKLTMELIYQRQKRYGRIRRLFTLVLCVIAACVFLYVNDYLKEYERAQPEGVANDVISKLSGGDYTDLTASGERAELSAWLRARFAGVAFDYYEAFTERENALEYIISADGAPVATLLLNARSERNKYGTKQWEISALNLQRAIIEEFETSLLSALAPVITATPSVTPPPASALTASPTPAPRLSAFFVRANETSRVYVNGALLGAESVLQSGIETRHSAHLIEGAPSQYECVYKFERADIPDLRVIDASGREQTLTQEDGVYVAARNYDDADYSEHIPLIDKAFKNVCEFVVGFASFDKAAAYAAKDTMAYAKLFDYARWKNPSGEQALKVNHGEVSIRDFVALSADSFCCDVSEQITCEYKYSSSTLSVGYTFYFRAIGDKWLLYDYVIM